MTTYIIYIWIFILGYLIGWLQARSNGFKRELTLIKYLMGKSDRLDAFQDEVRKELKEHLIKKKEGRAND